MRRRCLWGCCSADAELSRRDDRSGRPDGRRARWPHAGRAMYPGNADGRRQRGRVAGQRVFVSSTTKRSSNWHPRPRQRCEVVGKLASSPCMRVRNPLGRTRIAEGSLTEKSGSELMDEERINTDAELAQYVENILEKGKLPSYVGERPLVFPVCIGTNDYGRSLYQLECKCQIRGSIYGGYPEKVGTVFPKCARCIEEVKRRHKKAVHEEERQAKKARKQARKERRRREATRSLPIWAQWLLLFLGVLGFVLAVLGFLSNF